MIYTGLQPHYKEMESQCLRLAICQGLNVKASFPLFDSGGGPMHTSGMRVVEFQSVVDKIQYIFASK